MSMRVHAPVSGLVMVGRDDRPAHRRLKLGLTAYVRGANPLVVLLAPVIYSLLLPLAVLHAWVWAYERMCFPVYGIARVAHRRYFVLDRHRLAYLNGIEKAHCTFCSYANGVVGYVREVTALTEKYWCPIKHKGPVTATHPHYQQFIQYGDAEGYRQRLGVGATSPASRRQRNEGSEEVE